MPVGGSAHTALWTDSEAPVITLSGSTPITILRNTTYTDA